MWWHSCNFANFMWASYSLLHLILFVFCSCVHLSHYHVYMFGIWFLFASNSSTHNSLKQPVAFSQLPAHIPFQMLSNSSWNVTGYDPNSCLNIPKFMFKINNIVFLGCSYYHALMLPDNIIVLHCAIVSVFIFFRRDTQQNHELWIRVLCYVHFFFSVLKDTFVGFEFNKACLLVVVVLKSLYPSLHFQVYARYESVIQPQHPKNTKKTQFWLGLLRKGSGPGWSIQRSFWKQRTSRILCVCPPCVQTLGNMNLTTLACKY